MCVKNEIGSELECTSQGYEFAITLHNWIGIFAPSNSELPILISLALPDFSLPSLYHMISAYFTSLSKKCVSLLTF